jgi:hypothetical protein
MSLFRFRLTILSVLVLLVSITCLPAQEETKLSEQQMKDFLLHAKVIANKQTSKGITSPYRLTLTDGTITHDAGFNYVNETKNKMEFADGHIEYNFKDSYKYDIAAYELAKLVGLGDMMPVYVERKWNGLIGAASWWLSVMMDEATRLAKHVEPPDSDAWNKQMYKKRIFAELVYDTDPNLTNVLISKDWHLWMIDFTRAFRLFKDIRDTKNLTESKCARQLLEKLRKLDRAELTLKTKEYLSKGEIDGVMGRRDKIVALYNDLIAKKGENAVLYDDPAVK